MELRHLRCFVVVAEEENFHRAAERLHVSQSPLSRTVRDLQAELGVDLLEPAGRGVRLTRAGRAFAGRARDVLAEVDRAVDQARQVAHGQVGRVRIGFETGTAYFGSLAPILTAARRERPRVTLDLVPMSTAEQWSALRERRIDLGYGHQVPDDGSLACVEVVRDRLGVVLGGDHRLVARRRVTVADLAGEAVALQPRRLSPRLHDDLLAATRERGVVLDVREEVLDLEALLMVVSSGDAVTFLPESDAGVVGYGSARWRPVEDLDVHRCDLLAWRAQDDGSPLLAPLVEVARRAAGGPGPDRGPGRRRAGRPS